MLQYVDNVSCSLNETKDTLVIHFKQNEPIVSETDGKSIQIVTHDIASVVMDSDCAKGLVAIINQLYNSSDESDSKVVVQDEA